MIYIAEDNLDTLALARFALGNAGYHTEGFETAQALWAALEKRRPALVLLAIMLPDENGIDMLGRLRARPDTAKLPVILVSQRATELDKVMGLNAGADDYITKPFGVMELVARVKALLRRAGMEAQDRFACGPVTLDAVQRQVSVNGRGVELSHKEFALLRLLMQNRGIALSRRQIVECVWEAGVGDESRTVDVHVGTLRQKLGEGGAIIRTVRGMGYMADDGQEETHDHI